MKARRGRWAVALGAAVVTVSLGLLPAPESFAAPVCTGGVGAGLTYTCTPNSSGYVQVTVPAGVASINVTADGGGGGKNASLGNGGSGARLNASFTVSAGNVLKIYVGAGGGAGLGGSGNVGGAGYGAGGNGGAFYGEGFGGGYGGGGGGSSALLIGGTPVLVAGGGGGGGNFYGGSAAAVAGGSGGNGGGSCAVGGVGGNAAGSGSAGTTSGTGNPGTSSTGYSGRGGAGIFGAGGASSGGGGGGGGYGGGGAGNWNGPANGCTLAGGGGAGGSYGPAGTVYGSASNAGGVATSGRGGDGQVAVSFIAAPATAPGAPTDLVFSDVTSTGMTLYWSPPASDGGSALLGYDVTVNSGSPTRVTDTARSLEGLSAGQTYSVSITAVNAVGSSTALTGSQQTATPGTPTGPATNLVFSGVSSSTITATWTAPSPVSGWPTLGYQVRVDGGTLTWSPTTTYTASGLSPAESHAFEIYVVNGAGSSTALTGSESTYATVSDAPTDLVFSNVTSSAITGSWTPPVATGGASIVKYWVSIDGGASVDAGNVTSYTWTGLTSSTWHTFTIAANNGIGNSLELTGSRATTAPAGSPMITATSVVVGSASTISLTGYPASTTQTVLITAPDASTSNVSVTVNGSGAGTGTYTPSGAGVYDLVTSPDARSTSFTATNSSASGSSSGEGTSSGASTSSASTSSSGTSAVTSASQVSQDTAHVTTSGTRPTITIRGIAGRGQRAGRAYITGRTNAPAGTKVTIRVRLAGTGTYVNAGTRRVTASGTFTWQQRTPQAIYAYARIDRGHVSNRVLIRPNR